MRDGLAALPTAGRSANGRMSMRRRFADPCAFEGHAVRFSRLTSGVCAGNRCETRAANLRAKSSISTESSRLCSRSGGFYPSCSRPVAGTEACRALLNQIVRALMQHSLEFLRSAVSYSGVRLCVERRDRGPCCRRSGAQAGAIALVYQRCDHDLFFGFASVALKGRPL